MLALAANTGLRASDVTGLRLQDVDLERGELRVHVHKTGRLDHLPITADLDRELRRWLGWFTARMAYIGQPMEGSFLLFPALGHRNVRRNGVMQFWGDPQPHARLAHPARVVQRALQRIGIEDTTFCGFHTIRRSTARLMFDSLSQNNYDNALRLTASLLGHRATATTERYLGIDQDREKRNEFLRGRSLLGQSGANVTPIRKAHG